MGEAPALSGSENQTYERTRGVFGQIIVAMLHCGEGREGGIRYRLERGQLKNLLVFIL